MFICMFLTTTDLRMVNIACLTTTIISTLFCNALVILFVHFKESRTTLKDRIITFLCFTNTLQTIGYTIGLYAVIANHISRTACLFSAFLLCSLTYSSIGYLVSLTLERYIAIKYPYKYLLWMYPSTKAWIWLLLPSLIGPVVGVAPILGWGRYGQSRETNKYCGFDFLDDSAGAKSYLVFVVVGVLVVPISITVVCFANILLELQRTASVNRRMFGKGKFMISTREDSHPDKVFMNTKSNFKKLYRDWGYDETHAPFFFFLKRLH